jgi:hypothetical protein
MYQPGNTRKWGARKLRIMVYRYRPSNVAFTKTHDTTLTAKKKVVQMKLLLLERYIIAVCFPTHLVLFDVVRGRNAGEMKIPAEDRCQSIASITSMKLIFGNNEQNVVISCAESNSHKSFYTLYAVNISRGETMLVNLKNPIMLRANIKWTQKTQMRRDIRFILGKDVLFIVSYREKLIDIFHFREVNGYKVEGSTIKPSSNNIRIIISQSGQGYALLLLDNYIVAVYEVFCHFPDCIIKKRKKDVVKEVKPFLIFPLKLKINIDNLVVIHDDSNVGFLGRRNVKTVRMYRENHRQDSV